MKSWRLVVRVDVAPCCDQHFGRNCTKKISSSSLMVGICHLTDSHHYHHGQKPTRVGICHGGNMLGNRERWPSCLEPVKSLIRSQISLPTLNTAPTQPLQVYIVQVHSPLQSCYKYPVPTQDIALTQVPHRCRRVSGAQLGPELRRKSSLTPSLTASENPSRLMSVKL